MLKLSIIYGILYIANDRNETANWRIIQRNNGMRNKQLSWRSVMTVLRNTDSTGQVSGRWGRIAGAALLCLSLIHI